MLRSFLLAAALAPLASADAGGGRPNLVLFLVDDLGWQDVSVPHHAERTAANDRFRTPHLERLAAEGVTLTQAYASSPVCTPTRTSILTGKSPARTGITYWILHEGRDTSARHERVRPPAWRLNGLDERDDTLPRRLREAGYRTIHVGKAHFGARGTPGADPTRLGFDVNVAGHAAGAPGSYLGTDRFSGATRGRGDVWDVPGLEEAHGEDVYLTEVLAARAVAAVEEAAAEGRPFYLSFAPYAVHTPIMANGRYLERYEGLDPREAAYATMVESVDAALGALLDALERLELLDETAIVFTSDNGGLAAHGRAGAAHTQNAPLRSGKGSAYEGGTRVPFVARVPGVTRPGTRSDVPVVAHDLFPTFLALAGLDPDGLEIDGRDLAGVLAGGAFDDEREILWHMPHFWGVEGPGIQPYSALRKGDWKIVHFHGGRLELYDLGRDLGERNDLAAAEPERTREMAEALSAALERAGAAMSIDRETGVPVPLPRFD
ncbi:MAG: sulfatase [Planctomycetota bacterium JB042]